MDSGNVTLENGSTEANIEVDFDQPLERLELLFTQFHADLIVTVGVGGEDPTVGGAKKYRLNVTFHSVDSSDYTRIATNVIWKGVEEARRVISASTAGWTVEDGFSESRMLAGAMMHMYTLSVSTKVYEVGSDQRRYVNQIYSITMGYNSSNYDEITLTGQVASYLEVDEPDPWRKIPIPAGSDAVYQRIGNPDQTVTLVLYDAELVDVLFRETAVTSAGGTTYSVTSTGRYRVEYMIIKCYATVAATAGTSSTKYRTYTLADLTGDGQTAYVGGIREQWDNTLNMLSYLVTVHSTNIVRADES
jgi:hypothetical protein